MTREEAIHCLSVHSSTNGSGLCTDEQHYEAKQMAIKALEQEPCETQMIDKSNFSQEQYKADLQCAYDCGKASVKPCEDAIRRQAVLDLCDSKDPDYKVIHFKEDVECLPPVTPQMMDQWQELKETIIEMRDNNGTGTQQEVCKFLANLMDVLEKQTQESKWTSVNEGLPKDRDWYLGIFKEPDTGWINPVPFICDYVGRETKATTKEYWILRGFTDRDEHIDYYYNLECVEWMPLPDPYKLKESEEV